MYVKLRIRQNFQFLLNLKIKIKGTNRKIINHELNWRKTRQV